MGYGEIIRAGEAFNYLEGSDTSDSEVSKFRDEFDEDHMVWYRWDSDEEQGYVGGETTDYELWVPVDLDPTEVRAL